jgi:acyl-CoA synthetase (AMP-forming)/AMP-acid ligase II
LANLSLNLSDAAVTYPDRPATRLDDVVLTYAGLDDLAAGLATRLSRRINRRRMWPKHCGGMS